MTSNDHHHLDLLLESAVSKLEASMKKMEKLAHTADIMAARWQTPMLIDSIHIYSSSISYIYIYIIIGLV